MRISHAVRQLNEFSEHRLVVTIIKGNLWQNYGIQERIELTTLINRLHDHLHDGFRSIMLLYRVVSMECRKIKTKQITDQLDISARRSKTK